MQIKLIYFGQSGKYKYEASYKSDYNQMYDVFKEVKGMRQAKNLPELVSGYWPHYIFVNSPDGYPGLITT